MAEFISTGKFIGFLVYCLISNGRRMMENIFSTHHKLRALIILVFGKIEVKKQKIKKFR